MTTTHLTIAEFERAIAEGEPGSTIVYATGDIGADRGKEGYRRLRIVADYARLLGTPKHSSVLEPAGIDDPVDFGQGKGYLTQKRVGPGIFAYRFTLPKRRPVFA